MKLFLEKDAAGEFLRTSSWLNLALTCPGHMGGPDSHAVITGYKIKSERILSDAAEYVIQYDVAGSMTSGGPKGDLNAFFPKRESNEVTFQLIQTPWGWKIKDFTWQMVLPEPSVAKAHTGWVPGDKDKFAKATAK